MTKQVVPLYPNPPCLHLQITFDENQEGTANVFNTIGLKLQSDIFILNKKEINVSGLAKGNYIVTLNLQDRRIVNNQSMII